MLNTQTVIGVRRTIRESLSNRQVVFPHFDKTIWPNSSIMAAKTVAEESFLNKLIKLRGHLEIEGHLWVITEFRKLYMPRNGLSPPHFEPCMSEGKPLFLERPTTLISEQTGSSTCLMFTNSYLRGSLPFRIPYVWKLKVTLCVKLCVQTYDNQVYSFVEATKSN